MKKRIEALASEDRIAVKISRTRVYGVEVKPWDVSGYDDAIRRLAEEVDAATGRLKERFPKIDGARREACASISRELDLFKHRFGSRGKEFLVASPDHAAVRSLTPSLRANPQTPDFFADPQANAAMVERLVKAGLSIKLSAYINDSHGMALLTWRCEIGDHRGRSTNLHHTFSAEGLGCFGTICWAVCEYLRK